MRTRSKTVAAICVSLAQVACYDTYRIKPEQLKALDGVERIDSARSDAKGAGLSTPEARRLNSETGEPLTFDANLPLTIVTSDGKSISKVYDSIRVDERQFSATTEGEPRVQVPLNGIDHGEIPQYNKPRSAVAGVFVGLGIVACAALSLLTIWLTVGLAASGGWHD